MAVHRVHTKTVLLSLLVSAYFGEGATPFNTCDRGGNFETRGEEVGEGRLREKEEAEEECGNEDEGQTI